MDDEITELYDAEIPRVDLVDKAANGMRFLIAKNADNGGGLIDPALVRELIGKSEPEPEPVAADSDAGETVTVTGSPGAIAKMIHEAALAKAERSTKSTNDLADDQFAYIESGGKKDDEGKTTPRSLRHFPIDDEAHVRNALSRAPQSPFGDKAMPKIRAAAKKFGIEVAKEMTGMEIDPAVALAEPDGDMPGDAVTEPGSPAWEAVDAATARKWAAILARAKNALNLLADREYVETTSVDPSDEGNIYSLDEACCALDHAISVLAPYAVAEQAEADCATDMQAVGKALAGFDSATLDTIEVLSQVTKAGRVLSAANEAAIRGAAESLQKVLASLPQAPEAPEETGRPVAKKEETMAETTTLEETGAETVEKTETVETVETIDAPAEPVEKADKIPQIAVYDHNGNLVGIVDPDSIVPIAAPPADEDGEVVAPADGDATPDGAQTGTAPDPADLTPAPAAEVGTPADAVPDDVNKQTTPDTTTTTDDTDTDAVLKSIVTDAVAAALADYSATQEQAVAKQATDLAQMAEVVETLKGQVEAYGEQPAPPKVFTNGAVPPAALLRGQDHGAPPIDVAKAAEMRQSLYKSHDATEQNRIAAEMNAGAIDALQAIHQRRASQ